MQAIRADVPVRGAFCLNRLRLRLNHGPSGYDANRNQFNKLQILSTAKSEGF